MKLEGKALTYLQQINEWWNNKNIAHNEYIRCVRESTAFYSQPFKPETIMELFQPEIVNCRDGLIESNEMGTLCTHLPSSLDVFIVLCQHEGVELEWKEGIEI